MQHVAGYIERKVLLELPDVVELAAAPRLVELVERVVGSLHVRGVMRAVVQLDGLLR